MMHYFQFFKLKYLKTLKNNILDPKKLTRVVGDYDYLNFRDRFEVIIIEISELIMIFKFFSFFLGIWVVEP